MKPVSAPRVADLAIAVTLASISVTEVWLELDSVMGEGSRGLTATASVVTCLSLAFRRTHPLPTALVVLLIWPVLNTFADLLLVFWGQFVPMVVVLYSVVRHGTRREGLIGMATGASALLYADFRVPEMGDPSEIFFHWTVSAVACTVGWFVRDYEHRAHAQAARAVHAESTSRQQALQAVADERARIARELHDIVAHSVSVMVVQAGAAQKAIDDPEFVGKALDSIRSTGTSALAEMRRVVSLIRDDDAPVDLRPQPNLADLEGLVADMDVRTTLRIEGDSRPLEAGVALSAFRIVQEALTNVRRHASADEVEVTLRYLPESLEIEVADDGVGAAAAGGGNGLIGMRERAEMYGGTVDTTTAPGEGFRVRAVLPMVPAESVRP